MHYLYLTHDTTHRIHRVGACPVLELTVTYPRIGIADGEASSAVERFNEAYRTMAENWLAWAESVLLSEANEAFAAEGAGASYRFERRVAVCQMSASELPAEGECLTVTRTLRLTTRRGGQGEKRRSGGDRWRWPSLTLSEGRNPQKKLCFFKNDKKALENRAKMWYNIKV